MPAREVVLHCARSVLETRAAVAYTDGVVVLREARGPGAVRGRVAVVPARTDPLKRDDLEQTEPVVLRVEQRPEITTRNRLH